MAALRPVVLVFQEFAEVSVAAAQPDLNTVIVGPAYHCLDFASDKDDIDIGEYGSQAAACDADGDPLGLPVTGQDAIVVADPPANQIGAELDESTVVVYLDETLVQVTKGTAAGFSTTAPDENEFTDGAATFDTDGVAIGDRLVGSYADGTTFAKVVQEIESGTVLRTTANETGAGVDVTGAAYSGQDPTTIAQYRIEREIADEVALDASFYDIDGNEITILGGITVLVDLDGDGTDDVAQVNFANVYVEYCSLRSDLAKVAELEGTSGIESAVGPIDERNPLAVGLFVALQNTTTPIKYYGIPGDNINGASDRLLSYTNFLDVIEPRTDIYCIVPLSTDLSVVQAIKAHVTGLADPEVSNFRIGIGCSEGLPETKTMSGPSITGEAEQISTDDIDVFAVTAGGPTFQTDGVADNDTLALVNGGGTLDGTYTVEQVYDDERLQLSAAVAGETNTSLYYVLRGTGVLNRTLTGVVVDISNNAPATIEVLAAQADVNDVGKVIRLTDTVTNDGNSPLLNNDYLITGVALLGADGGVDALYTVAEGGVNAGSALADEAGPLTAEIINTQSSVIAAAGYITRLPFRRLLDPNATFATDAVIPTDILEVPVPAVSEGVTFTTVEQLIVNTVESENRVTLVAGSDIPTTNVATGQTDIGYRIARTLAKADQVDELIAVVESLADKRIVMVWPDEVLVAGVQNANTGVQSRQPGFYLACAVGGLSAGLPAHQGFTNIGIAGIDQIFNSTRYFSQSQLTDISNAGWFLFEQETENSTPFVVHQLTTDVSTTENGELSIVRDFDFISLFYKDILDDFIGKYNVINQTLDLLRESLNAGTTQLQAQKLPRIGAPLIDAEITSIEVLEGQKDRVEIFMDVQLPFPLNRIGLHLVA
jgi:hypothetical protein